MPYITVREECKRNSKLPSDLDNLRSRYLEEDTILDFSSGLDTDISVLFPAFEIYAYEKNRFYLLSNSTPFPFLPRWQYRPDYVSYDVYSSVIYWPVILFVNGIDSIEDFIGFDNILIPSPNVVKSLSSDRLSKNNIDKVTAEPAQTQADVFVYKTFLFDDKISARRDAIQLLNSVSETAQYSYANTNISDAFVFTQDIIRNKYVDLTEVPVSVSSIVVYYEGYQLPLRYGVDYMLSTEKRLTWSSDYNSILTRSMINSFTDKLGKTLTIQYPNLKTTKVRS